MFWSNFTPKNIFSLSFVNDVYACRSALESIRTNGVAEMVRLQNEEETLFLDIMIIIR